MRFPTPAHPKFALGMRPQKLPTIPELRRRREDEERRRAALYGVPGEGAAPVEMAMVGATPSLGNSWVWAARCALRAFSVRGLLDGPTVASFSVLAGLTFAAAVVGFHREEAAGRMPADFFSSRELSMPAAAAPEAPAQGAGSVRMLVPDELPAPREAVHDAPAPAAAASEPAPAVRPSVEIPAGAPEGADVGARLPKPAASTTERLGWSGKSLTAVSPLGGAFREMRVPREALAASPRAAAARARRAAALRSGRLARGTQSHALGASAARAMGQLKLARNMSTAGSAAPTAEAARQASADAFDQKMTIGGAGLASDAVPNTGLSGGAPDLTSSAPALPAGENKTPYQKQVDDAKQKNGMTKMMLILGALLIAAGLTLLALAEAEVLTGEWLKPVAYALIGAGAALVLAGFLMGQQAKDDGKQVADQYGQKDQGAVIEDCAEQALGKSDCAPKAVEQPKTTVHEAVEAESKAGYSAGAAGAR